MAVEDRFRGHDLGTLLIQEAFNIAVRLKDSVGFVAMLVGAKTDNLVNYYEQRGFTRLPEGRTQAFHYAAYYGADTKRVVEARLLSPAGQTLGWSESA